MNKNHFTTALYIKATTIQILMIDFMLKKLNHFTLGAEFSMR